jgi:uncharacterized membrane protein
MDLGQDYAIRWMLENVDGSPVVANQRNLYRWACHLHRTAGRRRWEWHQQQQRRRSPNWVSDRIFEIKIFTPPPISGA